MRALPSLLALAALVLAAGCDSAAEGAADDPPAEWGAPSKPLLHPITFEANAAPAVGDTARLSAAFRFVEAADSPFIAEHGFRRLVDSLYAADGPLWVEGKIEVYPYLDHSAPSEAARLTGSAQSFAGSVTPADTVRLGAGLVAIAADTVMAVVTLKVFSDEAGADGSSGSWGGGFKHACFVVREQRGIALGDCWDTTPER